MTTKHFFSVSLMFIASCQSNEKKSIYEVQNNDGTTTKKYSVVGDSVDVEVNILDSNGHIIMKSFEKEGKACGFIYCYFPNGNIEMEGKMKANKKDGWFKFYDSSGRLIALREYINFRDTSIARLNRVIKFDTNGDTLKSESFYYTVLSTNDTIGIDDTIFIKLIVNAPSYKQLQVRLCEFDSVYNDLKNNSCDIYEVRNNELIFALNKNNFGKNYVRGLIYYYGKNLNNLADSNFYTAELYFTVDYFVNR